MGTHTEAGLVKMTSDRAHEVWYPSRKPAHLARDRFALHDFAADRIGRDTALRFIEFGVHRGNTIKRFASLFTNQHARFFGFDSFIGLPEGWAGNKAGHFSTGGDVPDVNDPRTAFIKGWFQNTVPAFLHDLAAQPICQTLVHFDADIYSSTLFLLSALWWHVTEYWFIMDEFIGEELAATRNFISAYPAEIEFFSRTDNYLGEPVQIFGRLRRVPMVVNGVG